MEDREKLSFFRELITCTYNIYSTEYDAVTFDPIYSNAPDDSALYYFLPYDFGTAFDESGKPQQELLLKESKLLPSATYPVVGTNSLGMVWIAAVELSSEKQHRIHVIGPVFINDYSIKSIEAHLLEHKLSPALQRKFLEFAENLPVVPPLRFYEYALMLHYTLTAEKITISDLRYLEVPEQTVSETGDSEHSFHETYLAEQKMMQIIREGNLQYRAELEQLSLFSNSGVLTGDDMLRDMKDRVIVFTSLCCRAAIEGGLSPQNAYALSNRYIRNIETAEGLSSLTDLGRIMVDDFVHRVHSQKKEDGLSPQIRNICSAISLDPQKDWQISDIAESLGYVDYYFSRKFKQETGMSVAEYVTLQRIELAKRMLLSGNIPVSSISDQLGFPTHSSFGMHFREITGMTPSEFRSTGGAGQKNI